MKKILAKDGCREWDALDIADYHDDAMAESRRNKFEEHLLTCRTCRTAYRGLLNDATVMAKPDSLVEKARSLFRLLSGVKTLVIRLTAGGLKMPRLWSDGSFTPEFAPAVRGKKEIRVRAIVIPFFSSSGTGAIRVRQDGQERVVLECRLDRFGTLPARLALVKGSAILEEKIVSKRGKFSAEFLPLEKGSYGIRLDSARLIRLKIA